MTSILFGSLSWDEVSRNPLMLLPSRNLEGYAGGRGQEILKGGVPSRTVGGSPAPQHLVRM